MSPVRTRIAVGPSRLYASITITAHLGGIALLLGRAPLAALVPVVVAVLASLIRDLRLHALRASPSAIVGVDTDGTRWVLQCRDGRREGPCAVIDGVASVTGVWLRLRTPQGRLRCLNVPGDALPRDSLRRLRLRARLALAESRSG